MSFLPPAATWQTAPHLSSLKLNKCLPGELAHVSVRPPLRVLFPTPATPTTSMSSRGSFLLLCAVITSVCLLPQHNELCEVRAGFIPQPGTHSAQSVDNWWWGDQSSLPYCCLIPWSPRIYFPSVICSNWTQNHLPYLIRTQVSSSSLQEFFLLFCWVFKKIFCLAMQPVGS